MNYLTTAQRRKLPRNLQRSIESYNKSMDRATKSMAKLMDGGFTTDYVDGKFKVRKLMSGGKCYACGGKMATGGQVADAYATGYGRSHNNPMAIYASHNINADNAINSPANALMRGVYNYGGYVSNSPISFNSPQSFALGGNYNQGFGTNQPVTRNYYQEGGMADSSDMYAAQLAQGQMADPAMMQQQQAPQAPQQGGVDEQQLMELAQLIAQGDQEAIQLLKQLPPEIQQQVIAMVEQMQGGQQQMPQGQMQQGGPLRNSLFPEGTPIDHTGDLYYNKMKTYRDSTYDAIRRDMDKYVDQNSKLSGKFPDGSYDDNVYKQAVAAQAGKNRIGSSKILGPLDAGYSYMAYADPVRLAEETLNFNTDARNLNKAERIIAAGKLYNSGMISDSEYRTLAKAIGEGKDPVFPKKSTLANSKNRRTVLENRAYGSGKKYTSGPSKRKDYKATFGVTYWDKD